MPLKSMFLIVSLLSAMVSVYANVSIRDTTWVFKQYETEKPLNQNGTYPWNGNLCKGPCTVGNKGTIEVPDTKAKIIENEYLKVVVAPSIGGRVMSIIHKETGTEQLYHANTAVPYQGPAGVFYYNYLLVHGGILPTFPGPEHGRTWNQKWDIEIVENSSDRGAVKISYLDDHKRGSDEFNPTDNFPVEKDSKLYCAVEISLDKGHAAMGYRVHFENKNDHDIGYEFWTLTTLAPGTDPEYTALPKNTLILSPTKKVQLRTDIWNWMNDLISPTDGDGTPIQNGVLSWFDRSSRVDEWVDEGIMYAYPQMTKDWWGAINLDNNTGVLRIAPHEVTPGMKYWSWGFKAFQDNGEPVDLNAKDENRSHIELWGGRSREFTVLADPIRPGIENAIEWDEFYYPTFELDTIHFANEYGAIQIKKSGSTQNILISSTLPQKRHSITVGGEMIEAVAPVDKAIILEATEGCFDQNVSIQITVDGEERITFTEDIGVSGQGTCELSVLQEGEEIVTQSSTESISSVEEISSVQNISSDEGELSSSSKDVDFDSSSDALIESSEEGTASMVLYSEGFSLDGNVLSSDKRLTNTFTMYNIDGRIVARSSIKQGMHLVLSNLVKKKGAYIILFSSVSGNKELLWYNK